MKHAYFTLILVLIGSVALLVSISLPSEAASFSGRVVDEEGQPVEGLIIALRSFPGDSPLPQGHRVQVRLPRALETYFRRRDPMRQMQQVRFRFVTSLHLR